MSQLTKHFKTVDFLVSSSNPYLARLITLSELDKYKLYVLCKTILDPLWGVFGPIISLSGKRTIELNRAVGGSDQSDHLFYNMSCADDFTFKRAFEPGKNTEEYIRSAYIWIQNKMPFGFGQLIIYPDKNFLHCSLPTPKHRGETLEK